MNMRLKAYTTCRRDDVGTGAALVGALLGVEQEAACLQAHDGPRRTFLSRRMAAHRMRQMVDLDNSDLALIADPGLAR